MALTTVGNGLVPFRNQRLYPDKSRGQNFLIDKNVLRKIIAAAELSKKDMVIEIGAGTGVLTAELAKRAGRVAAFEIDRKLASILRENLKEFKNVEIRNEDILSCHSRESGNPENTHNWIPAFAGMTTSQCSNYKIVSNIPYNITSAVLEKFLSAENKPSLMVLLVQKEVAERVCGKPGQMSVLSVMVQYYGQPQIVARVPSSAFWPRPKVNSAILKIKDIKEIKDIKDINFEKKFFQIVKAGFSRRRKMLKNNLKEQLAKNKEQIEEAVTKVLEKVGLSPTVRAQELSIEQWVKLALAFLRNNDKIGCGRINQGEERKKYD